MHLGKVLVLVGSILLLVVVKIKDQNRKQVEYQLSLIILMTLECGVILPFLLYLTVILMLLLSPILALFYTPTLYLPEPKWDDLGYPFIKSIKEIESSTGLNLYQEGKGKKLKGKSAPPRLRFPQA